MKDPNRRFRVVAGIVLAVLCIFALLPKMAQCFWGDFSIWEKLLKVVVYIGVLILLWGGIIVIVCLLNILASFIVSLFVGSEKAYQHELNLYNLFVIPGIIILIMQFIDGWGIQAGFLRWVVYQLFPFIQG